MEPGLQGGRPAPQCEWWFSWWVSRMRGQMAEGSDVGAETGVGDKHILQKAWKQAVALLLGV